MGYGSEVAGSVYHPRQPQQTPFYQLVRRFQPQDGREIVIGLGVAERLFAFLIRFGVSIRRTREVCRTTIFRFLVKNARSRVRTR